MSVNVKKNGTLTKIAGLLPPPMSPDIVFKSNDNLDWEEYNLSQKQDTIPTYTTAEYEAIKDSIPEGTLFNISDDADFRKSIPPVLSTNILYLDEKPVMLLDNLSIYINYETGSDTSGDGSSTNPYKTWEYVSTLVPRNLNGYKLNIYIHSSTTLVQQKHRLSFSGFSGSLNVYGWNNPTFYTVICENNISIRLIGPLTIDVSSSTSDWTHGIGVLSSNLIIQNAITINGNTNINYHICGILCRFCGQVSNTSWYSDAGTLTINNCMFALYTDWGGNIRWREYLKGTGNTNCATANGGTISFSSNTTYSSISSSNTSAAEGGQIIRS